MTKVLKPFYLLALYLAASFLNAYIPLENIRVIDGDTVKGKVEGKQITIRLVEIDAPEMDQPFGLASKNFLMKLTSNEKITYTSEGEDRYGRTLGKLFKNKENLNALMVKSGFAWVYERYAKNQNLYVYQEVAKSKNLGLWQSKKPIAPWVWRRKK